DARAALVAPYAAPPARPILPSHAADVDDASGPARDHPRRKRRHERERRANVGREQGVERGHVEFCSGSSGPKTSVVDQDVDIAYLSGQACDACGITEIGRYEPGAPALRSDRLDRLGTPRSVAAVDDDLGARGGEPEGDRFADTGR